MSKTSPDGGTRAHAAVVRGAVYRLAVEAVSAQLAVVPAGVVRAVAHAALQVAVVRVPVAVTAHTPANIFDKYWIFKYIYFLKYLDI